MLSFIIATSLVCLIPGPSIFLVVLNTLQQGLSAGVKTIVGVVIADAILMALTLMGVGSLLYSSAIAFSILKWLGAAYLIYLGISQLRSKSSSVTDVSTASKHPIAQGIGITLLNPKIIGFFIAFFPQFINQDQPFQEQIILLGSTFLVLVFFFMFLYALLAVSVRSLIDSPKGNKIVNKVSGFTLIGCGALAATMSRS